VVAPSSKVESQSSLGNEGPGRKLSSTSTGPCPVRIFFQDLCQEWLPGSDSWASVSHPTHLSHAGMS
jgi:hypothetical protein